ncbi:MAG: hypothetical protein ABIB41_01340 [Nitrospirota bacterium]
MNSIDAAIKGETENPGTKGRYAGFLGMRDSTEKDCCTMGRF